MSAPTDAAPPLTADDVERIAGDLVDAGDSFAWLVSENITLDAMSFVLGSAWRAFERKVKEDGDTEGALVDVVGQTFRLAYAIALARSAASVTAA